MSALEFQARCYLCHEKSQPYTYEGHIRLPESWRAVRRGYAGEVMICPTCNSRGWKYQKDVTESMTPAPPPTEKSRAVVRLRTSTWSDRKGVHIRRSLTYLRKLCRGYNVLEEDVANLGAEDAVGQIINLEECPDGIYEVRICNQTTDWETGYVDGYDLKLIPFSPQEKP